MSWEKRIVVFCDGCPDYIKTMESTMVSARMVAKSEGWSLKNATRGYDGERTKDYCPRCTKTHKEA